MKTKKFVDGTVSPKINWNEALNTAGDTLKGIFKKPDTYVTNNTTYVQPEEEKGDNTMLYVGIGGAVLVVVILLVMMRK